MTPSNDICPICSYAGSAQYCDWPSAEQRRTGVAPLDSLPAAWWNNMWADTTNRINEARDMVGQLITELNSVLTQAGISPQSACVDQLYQSINLIRQRLATTTTAGAIMSSTDGGAVAVDSVTGKATINCLGNVAALTTSAQTIVGAVNELKSTYDCSIDDLQNGVAGKAPTNHASTGLDYGVGNADCYGHLKISDIYNQDLGCTGMAASQSALAEVWTCLSSNTGVELGNTVGCALGTAAAGTATTAARSDHIHPLQTKVACACCIMNSAGTAGYRIYIV